MNLPRGLALMLAGLLSAAVGPLAAQTAAPAAPAAPAAVPKDAPKDAKAEAEAAAMERARRLAANPMRVILEASRVRRRADGEPLPAPAPVAGVAAGVVAASTPAAPAEVAPRAVLPPPPREAPAPEPAIMSSDLAQARSAPASAPALAMEPAARPVTASPVPALAPMAALAPELARPVLISRVDPDPPPRLLVDLSANTVITADLTIRPDGSVSQVALVTPNTRGLGRFVVAALQQWRFAPLPGERVWRVDLVFRAE